MKYNLLRSLAALVAILHLGVIAWAQSPGGVTTAAWYRADGGNQLYSDAGSTAAANNSTLYQWNEATGKAYPLLQTLVGYRPVFSNSTTLANFNPTVTFDGVSNFMQFTAGTGVNVIDRANGTLYTAGYVNVQKGSGFTGFDATMDYPGLHMFANYNLLFFTGGPGYQGQSSSAMAAKSYFSAGTGWQNGTGSYASATVSLDGIRTDYAAADSKLFNVNLTTGRDFRIGGDSNYGAFSGQINEVLVFEDRLTSSQMDQVETYLAIKYGTTYADGGRDYKNSAGNTVWNATTNAGYKNNIAGVANDAALNQKQSWSTNPGQQVLISTTGLANTNAANANALSTGQYLIWGDNGGAKSLATAFVSASPLLNLRFGAVWKVQNTGTVGTVRVAWPAGIANLHLIQSADAVIDNSDSKTDMSGNVITINGTAYNYADVTLTDGQFFTFAGYLAGPGGVASAAWYRADAAGQQFSDAGATIATDGQQIQQWNEYNSTGFNLVQASAGNRPVFSNAAILANFNPTVTFSGAQWMRYTAPTGVNVIDRATGSIYAAGYMKSLNGSGFAGFDASMDYPGLHSFPSGANYNLLFFTGGPGYQGLSTSSFSLGRYFTAGSGWENGQGASAAYAGATVSLDGTRTSYNGSQIQNVIINDASRDFQIGQDNNYGALNGQLNEVVVFENKLSEDDMDRVETYMSIKYGTTFAAGSRNYKSSQLTTVWNATNNNGYQFNIAGIARDDQGSLYQKQSWSTNPGKQVLIGTTGLANTNAANTATLSNGQFLIWGDNNLAKAPTVAISGISGVNYRFASIWKVQNTNGVGTVRVTWPKGYTNLKLIRSADATIDASDNATDMTSVQTINGIDYAYADVTLSDGQYFTFAAFIQAPGGVTNNLSYWYRADKLATSGGEGSDVTSWTDFTSGTISAQLNGAPLPKYKAGDATYFNFNPGINFTAIQQMLGNINVQTLTNTSYDVYSLTKEGMSGTRFFNVGMDNTTFNGTNWDQPGFYADGSIARRTSTGAGNYFANPGAVTFSAVAPSIMYHTFGNTSLSKGLNGTPISATATHAAIGQVTGGHMFGANGGVNPPGGDDFGFTGNIGELVIYGNGNNTPAERNKVETYLAIKYGVTLDNSNDYTTSQNTVVWSSTANVGYYNNVAGVGNDFVSALEQKQSRSQHANTNSQVTMGVGGIAATNLANTATLNDGQFLVWGDNGNTQSLSTASTALTYAGNTNSRRMNRVWKVQNTSVGNSMLVRFPVASVGTTTLPADDACGKYVIIYASDAAFTTNVSAQTLTTNGTDYEATHTFPAGASYFTFGKVTACTAPDLTPIMYTLPTTVNGTKPITVVVDVVELSGTATSGAIQVYVSKDTKTSLSFSSSDVSVGGRSVNNSVWSFDGTSNSSYYILTTNQVIAGGNKLSFGLSGTLTPGATQGALTISAVIKGGSGGEVKVTNNVDADKIDYFQQ